MDSQFILRSTSSQDNGSSVSVSPVEYDGKQFRIGQVKRVTKETNVSVKINLDATGIADSSSGDSISRSHVRSNCGLFDAHVKATGDIHIDDHHSH